MSGKMRKILRSERRKKTGPSSVRRKLFIEGPLDEHHRKISEELKRELREIEEHQKKKYNFDFQQGVPLEGIYQWKIPDYFPTVKRLRNDTSCKAPVKADKTSNEKAEKVSESSDVSLDDKPVSV